MKKIISVGSVLVLSVGLLVSVAHAATICTPITGGGTKTDTIGTGAASVAGNNLDAVYGLITASASGALQSIGIDMVAGRQWRCSGCPLFRR